MALALWSMDTTAHIVMRAAIAVGFHFNRKDPLSPLQYISWALATYSTYCVICRIERYRVPKVRYLVTLIIESTSAERHILLCRTKDWRETRAACFTSIVI